MNLKRIKLINFFLRVDKSKNKLNYSIILFSLLLMAGNTAFLCTHSPLVREEKLNRFAYHPRNKGFFIEGNKMSNYIDGRSLKQCYCKDCGKEITKVSKRCTSCANRYRIIKRGKEHGNWGKRWKRSEETAERHRISIYKFHEKNPGIWSGVNSSNYKDGRTLKQYYCKDCSSEITSITGIYGMGRCMKCASKLRNKRKWGTKDSIFGITGDLKMKVKFCPNCGKQIHWQSNKCGSCARIGIKFSKKHLKNISLSHGGTGTPSKFSYSKEFIKIRPKIRKKYNYTCQICGQKFDKYSSYLHIHHIDSNKENNNEDNLISLCNACHARTKCNREYWKSYFRRMVL